MDRAKLFSVVLAAGNARRFGSTKQLALYAGTPLVRRAVDTGESVCRGNSVLVLGSDWQPVLAACRGMQGFVVLNEDFASGLASSIRTAIHHLDAVAAGVLLLLADQPLVDAAQLEKLAESCTTNPGRIIASAYAGTIGPPVIFPREFFPELVDLSGDQGAKPVLERHRQLLITIKCEAAAVDIDHREDLGTR